MTVSSTLIRVASPVRDRIRELAAVQNATFSTIISDGLDLLEREQFWERVAAVQPDAAYLEEFSDWDNADLA
jgi:predicted transcriptional regulator